MFIVQFLYSLVRIIYSNISQLNMYTSNRNNHQTNNLLGNCESHRILSKEQRRHNAYCQSFFVRNNTLREKATLAFLLRRQPLQLCMDHTASNMRILPLTGESLWPYVGETFWPWWGNGSGPRHARLASRRIYSSTFGVTSVTDCGVARVGYFISYQK